LEAYIKQSLLPLTVPINPETLKILKEEDRKIVLTIVHDETNENSAQLIKVLRSAANANRDMIFSFVGVKQWEEFADRFDATGSVQLPKMVVWDGNEEYELVRLFLYHFFC
jgi:protein disulfide-isomerase A1